MVANVKEIVIKRERVKRSDGESEKRGNGRHKTITERQKT